MWGGGGSWHAQYNLNLLDLNLKLPKISPTPPHRQINRFLGPPSPSQLSFLIRACPWVFSYQDSCRQFCLVSVCLSARYLIKTVGIALRKYIHLYFWMELFDRIMQWTQIFSNNSETCYLISMIRGDNQLKVICTKA